MHDAGTAWVFYRITQDRDLAALKNFCSAMTPDRMAFMRGWMRCQQGERYFGRYFPNPLASPHATADGR
jgi:hypothetical protein